METICIRYDPVNGMAISEAKAEETVLAIPEITAVGQPFSVSTENVILAARAMLKEGKIQKLVLYFGDQVIEPDKRPDAPLADWLL